MKLGKIAPKYTEKPNPRIGLITLASDFRIEKDFNNIIYAIDKITPDIKLSPIEILQYVMITIQKKLK